MGSELSMAARREITKKYTREYEYGAASKKERGRMRTVRPDAISTAR
ncbi:hypothetical protein LVY72_07630 [Arthrobacter sp. I2-34]|uniref:Uncharacterized protein n=1 Tax=Arthrobacter hankyongi TaxID=2904801 RepID=A0ABS9L5N3_9MICC|nr:hypothetical protein [Arthrobacter hankyongi]MCG2621787.1 hypothetical protein [Arthrobacter hankyongi]